MKRCSSWSSNHTALDGPEALENQELLVTQAKAPRLPNPGVNTEATEGVPHLSRLLAKE